MKIIALLVLSSSIAAADPPIGATAKIDREIAIVERTPIWQSELDELLARVPAQGFSPDQKKQALDSLIDNVLIQHEADRLHLQATNEDVEAAIKEVEADNKIDDAGLEKALADQHFTHEQYREELARQIRAQRVYNAEIAPKITITDAEIDAEWAKHSKDAPTQEQRDQVHQMLWGQKMGLATQEWLAKKRAGAHVEVKP